MEVIVITINQLKTLLIESLSVALKYHQLPTQNSPDTEPYADFDWICSLLHGVPRSTIRIKSASGKIPGVVKVGKRVLYNKEIVLNWLKSLTHQSAPDACELVQVADEQIENQLAKRRNKTSYKGNNPRQASMPTKLEGNHGDL